MRPLTRLLNSWSQPLVWEQPDRLFRFTGSGEKETLSVDFEQIIGQAYKRNGIVFACVLARLMVFTEARFQWQELTDGRPGRLFDGPELELLRNPWPNGTTGDLLARMEQDASLAGNFYAAKVGPEGSRRLRRLRPDWVTIVTGYPEGSGPFDVDAEILEYRYHPKGPGHSYEPTVFTPERIIHYSPIPDPDQQWRGMSWVSPVAEEIMGDRAATRHKLNFFRNGATPGLVVTYDSSVAPADVQRFVEMFAEAHEGVDKAYKTIHLGGGADAKALATNWKELEFKATQGAGETRIAAAAGVHPVIAGLSEGLAGSSLNEGNFGAARRRFADGTIRPLWRMAAASTQRVLDRPEGARLWYDARDVAFLRDDAGDEADTRRKDAQTIQELVFAGFTPESSVAAVTAGDFDLLEHTGKTSVQLHDPDEETTDD